MKPSKSNKPRGRSPADPAGTQAGRSDAGISKYEAVEHLDKIGETAVYYGFTPMKSPAVTKADMSAARDVLNDDFMDDEDHRGKLPLRAEEKAALVRNYIERDWGALPQPVMIYMKDPCRLPAADRSGAGKSRGRRRYADLEILGPSGPMAEAILIQAGRAILGEEGYTDIRVEVNSVGDRDSIAAFARELGGYYRKNIDSMAQPCRDLLKIGPFALLASHEPECLELNGKAPRSMDFLSDQSRRHLEEVLEYIESLKVPYEVNNALLGNRSYCTDTVFALTGKQAGAPDKTGKPTVLAIGMRYNGLAKRLNMKKDIQGIGLSIMARGGRQALRESLKRVKRPLASFVQLGLESKLMALEVVERLRKARIPLQLALAKDRLGAQVSTVERYRTPFVIVMGKKEAMDGTAIVRKVDTYSQETVSLDNLPAHMKKLENDYWTARSK